MLDAFENMLDNFLEITIDMNDIKNLAAKPMLVYVSVLVRAISRSGIHEVNARITTHNSENL